jgi:hypothetical protein
MSNPDLIKNRRWTQVLAKVSMFTFYKTHVMLLIFKLLFDILFYHKSILWKESLNIEGQQFHQCQQNEQSPLALNTKKGGGSATTYDIGNAG